MFSENRERLIKREAVTELFNATVSMAAQRGLPSGERFSAERTLIKAWASHKSKRRKDGSDAWCVGANVLGQRAATSLDMSADARWP